MEIDVCRLHVARCEMAFICARLQPVPSVLGALIAKQDANKSQPFSGKIELLRQLTNQITVKGYSVLMETWYY